MHAADRPQSNLTHQEEAWAKAARDPKWNWNCLFRRYARGGPRGRGLRRPVNVGGVSRIRTVLTKPPKEKVVLYVGNGYFLFFAAVTVRAATRAISPSRRRRERQYACQIPSKEIEPRTSLERDTPIAST